MIKSDVFENDTTMEFYDELMSNAGHDDAGSRLRAASMIMERCGDMEMSDTLRTLSAQMDFDDNEEACAAIERTRTKLDRLIADRRSHESMGYIKKLRDTEILEISNGEVTGLDYDELGSSFCRRGLFDPDIFGGSGKIPFYDDENDKMPTKSFGHGVGHILMPVHVVLKEDYRLISRLLGISEDDVRCVAKYARYLVLEPGKSGLEKYDTLNEKGYEEHKDDEGLMVSIGGDAIHEALKMLGHADEPERLAFSVLAVCSPVARPLAYSREEDTYYSHPLNDYYRKVISCTNRCRKMAEIAAPEIILRNENRMLDDAVNELTEAAGKAMRQTHWTKSRFHAFIYTQISLVLRDRNLAMRRLTDEELRRTDDIESLGLFPENIILCKDSGETEPICLREVADHNTGAIYNYQQENIIELPGDVDMDNLDEETRARIEKLDAAVSRMRCHESDVLAAARTKGEECRVRYNEEEGMYVPA